MKGHAAKPNPNRSACGQGAIRESPDGRGLCGDFSSITPISDSETTPRVAAALSRIHAVRSGRGARPLARCQSAKSARSPSPSREFGLSTRDHAPKTQSGPAECPEDALTCLRRVCIFGEGRLILIRARENRQQLGERRKVSIVDCCVERLLHAMIARDESWIDGSHRLGACVGLATVSDQT